MDTESDTRIARTAKAALRRELGERIASLEPAAAARAAARMTERALAMPEIAGARRVLTCLSFGGEIDTWPLVDQLLEAGRELYVPRAEPRDKMLHVHPYPCELVPLSFGLEQPPRGCPEIPLEAVDDTVEVVLVLGLAFDRRGYRLGHGSGYFDRFLLGRPFPAVGLAYDFQLVDHLPVEPHDIPMTAIATDREVARPV